MGNKTINENQNLKHLIWIDPYIENEENQSYYKSMKELGFSNIKCFKTTDEGINYIKTIKFESSKIILSGRLYIEFIKKFKENIKNLCLIPKIAVFTGNKNKFLEHNKDNKENMNIINDTFYNFGKINDKYEDIKKFLIMRKLTNRNESNYFNENNEIKLVIENINNKEKLGENNDIQLTFEYIDRIEKLELPLLYQSVINLTKIDKIENYNEYLYSKYSKENNLIKLLNDINKVQNIPIELLCKYYIRLYTMESNFYKELNYDLRNKKKDNYLTFIKILYEGLKLKSLKLTTNNELYRGSKISIEEIKKIKIYLYNKKPNLPGAIVFSKSFLSFTKDIEIANRFLSNVLYILEKDDNIDYNLSTHSDIENLSFFKKEKEVLFFPFSSFEIKDINTKLKDNKKIYIIKLLYLGKYIKEIKNDKNIIEIGNKIPDSEFKNQILELGLIKQENIKNTKQLFNYFKKYEEEINNNINLNCKDIKKEIFEKIKTFILNNNLDKDKIIEELFQEIIDIGIMMKDEIIENYEKHPENYLSIEDTGKDENIHLLPLGLLAQNLEKLGIKIVIEKIPKFNKLSEHFSFMLLYLIMSGMILEKKHEIHFDFGEKRNNELLKNKIEQQQFNDKIKKIVSLKYNISENNIKVISLPSKNIYKILLFINTYNKKIIINTSIDINKLKINNDSNDIFKELNNIIYLNTSYLIEGCILNENILDSRGNKENGWSTDQNRGGLKYNPPLEGWKGYGLKVLDMYDGGNNDWINNNGNDNEWAVGYRLEKSGDNVLNLFYCTGPCQSYNSDYDLNHKGCKVGYGIYFSPDSKIMEDYANSGESPTINGKKYIYAFMTRVKPNKIRYPSSSEYQWILNGSTNEVRPYRILIKENLENIK